MLSLRHLSACLVLLVTFTASLATAEGPGQPYATDPDLFRLVDVFGLEWATQPRISPDGGHIVYLRNSMDAMKDQRRASLWISSTDGGEARPLTDAPASDSSPRWSPDGKRLLYSAKVEDSAQLYVRWMDSGQTARLTQLPKSPSNLTWSADGRWIAFTMFVAEKKQSFVELPSAPEGAAWAEPAVVLDDLIYRSDGSSGFVAEGHAQIFVVPAEGGTPRQLTTGPYNQGGALSWSPDGQSIAFAADRREDWQFERNTEIHQVYLGDGRIETLTDRKGPDGEPAFSPDGKYLAYVGYDDKLLGHQVNGLYVMRRDGSGSRLLTANLDRSVTAPTWNADGTGIYFLYSDEGNGKIGYVSVAEGSARVVAADVGGTSLGRPYSSGSFTVSRDGHLAYTLTRPDHPADVAYLGHGQNKPRRLTRLNDDLFGHKELAAVEEIWFESSHDQRRVQGWIAKPPGFDPAKKYPLILEIHGGPFANYGDRFAAEVQLFASAGYVVLYINPRGSTSYGEEFANLIHHAYPSHDYEDLMSGVDAVVAQGYVDDKNLFVTGGSGGGVLTAWIVGHTDRFRAAVSAKPVINWYSFAVTADISPLVNRYWFPGFPWDHPEQYLERSPLSYVGNVTTPTMLLTGEIDYRTPMSESEQFYQALKLRKIDSMLVRIQGAGHGIVQRPSNLMSKVAHILQWFEKYRQ